jgi:hypothetical protein
VKEMKGTNEKDYYEAKEAVIYPDRMELTQGA